MSTEDKTFEDQLLAYHMGWLNRTESARVEAQLEASPELAQHSARLLDELAPLADWSTLPASEDLDRHILRCCGGRDDDLSIADAVKLDPIPAHTSRTIRFPLTLREVIAASISLLLVTVVVVPTWARVVSRANRLKCADNLQHIALALGAYRQDYQDHLPFAGDARLASLPRANWLREPTPGVQRVRNSQNRYNLARTGYLEDTSHYVCPADPTGIIMRVDETSRFDDFAEARNDSYDSQLPLGAARRGLQPGMVVYADPNPLFDPRAATESGPVISLAHAGLSGQNVMRLDGAVLWTTSPLVGVENDDIWRIGRRLNYTGSEIPQFATDSFMIP